MMGLMQNPARLADSKGSGGSEPFWLQAIRRAAEQRFAELEAPVRKQEAWRYTRAEFLLDQEYELPETEVALEPEAMVEPLEADAHQLVLVNGRWSDQFSRVSDLPAGVWAGSLYRAMQEEALALRPGKISGPETHLFGAMNTAFLGEGVYIRVPRGLKLERPLELLNLCVAGANSLLIQPRVLLVLEEGAEAVLIERHGVVGEPRYFSNMVTEMHLQKGSRLQHYRMEEESPNGAHLAGLHLRQERESGYRSVSMVGGAAWTRTEISLDLAGKGAAADLQGLYLCGEDQLTDFHLDVRHRVPGCSSRERFKGILTGSGRAVFDGRILVEKQAQQSDARLSNDNLLLSREAEVDTKPQLEIYADDVVCSHGTTVGQLDDDMLYYLRARGLGEERARRMLCSAFANEIVEAAPYERMRERVERQLQRRLLPVARKEV
jgi:Fe-S cluster assembly protein SufD